MKKVILLLVAILINCAAFAQIPQIISWQGILQDANGNNLNGQFNVTCKFFDVATGGNALWTETHNNLQITDGLANISLGSVTALNLPFDKQYWLEITVDNGTPLPRIQLLSVPYSLYSTKSNGVIQNDSLVLKDSRGVTRMVLNPNTGTFKMMNNDTTWYELSVQSPKMRVERLGNGDTWIERSEGGKQISEIYRGLSLTYRRTESIEMKKDNLGLYSNQERYSKEEYFGQNPNTGEWEKVKETESNSTQGSGFSEKIFYERHFENGNLTNEIINKHKHEQTFPGIYNENYDIIYRKDYDKDGMIISEEQRISNQINNTDKWYIKKDGKWVLKEETADPATGTHSTTVTSSSGGGTTIEQTPTSLKYSNTGSSNSINIKEDGYLKKFDVSAYIGGNEKKVFRVDETGVYYGMNDNIQTSQAGTTFTGSVTSQGTTQFQGNTYHNGTNYFSGNIHGTNASFNGNVSVGTASSPKNLDVYGNATFTADAYFSSKSRFFDNVTIDGDLTVGGKMDMSGSDMTFKSVKSNGDISAKGAKKFVIDHPTDNTKLIQHAAIEANQVYNMYMGTVTTGSNSMATVTLPNYFPQINNTSDIFYQLTVESLNFVQAIVYSGYDEETNSFVIKTSSPNTTVHWQVTARRYDNYMQGHPFNDVINK